MKRAISLLLVIVMTTIALAGCDSKSENPAGNANSKQPTDESITIKNSPDKYTWYIKNYVGKNCASIGYTSMGGDRMDHYGAGYSSAKDPVNMAGFMIEDLESEKVRQFHWNEVEDLPCDGSATLLDVRTEGEYRRGHLNGFRNIPLDDLREHLDELDRSKPVYVNCQTGLRSYLACRLLTQYGFTCAHLSGGYSFYQVVTKEQQTARSAYPCGMEKL